MQPETPRPPLPPPLPSPHLDSGNLVSVARLLVYMWPPTSMWTGALALVSCAGDGMPWAVIGETGERLRDILDMLRPSWKQGEDTPEPSAAAAEH